MECRNHPTTPAEDRCAGCAEAFCHNCLVSVGGQKYCASCKVLPIQGKKLAVSKIATTPCKEANDALTCAIIGIFCFGFILGIVALSKASKARKAMREDDSLSGWGKTNAA